MEIANEDGYDCPNAKLREFTNPGWFQDLLLIDITKGRVSENTVEHGDADANKGQDEIKDAQKFRRELSRVSKIDMNDTVFAHTSIKMAFNYTKESLQKI